MITHIEIIRQLVYNVVHAITSFEKVSKMKLCGSKSWNL
jgi:hypothetical protein